MLKPIWDGSPTYVPLPSQRPSLYCSVLLGAAPTSLRSCVRSSTGDAGQGLNLPFLPPPPWELRALCCHLVAQDSLMPH